jgi:hypothetical protein
MQGIPYDTVHLQNRQPQSGQAHPSTVEDTRNKQKHKLRPSETTVSRSCILIAKIGQESWESVTTYIPHAHSIN